MIHQAAPIQKNSLPGKKSPRTSAIKQDLVLLRVEVTRKDFETMAYYYDSGMMDITTHNAAALALKRRIAVGHRVQVKKVPSINSHACLIDGEEFFPSHCPGEVLEKAEHGLFTSGFQFEIRVPRKLLK
jgi:hypothetical protein